MVGTILDKMAGALADGDRVELRDFGTFAIQDREPRTSRNPRSGASVAVSAKPVVHFKPSKAMRARLNHQRIEPEDEVERLRRSLSWR